MRWAGHVARMGRNGTHIGFWWEKPVAIPTELSRLLTLTRSVSEGNSILRGHSIGHSKQIYVYVHVSHSERFRR
jgi:hypothetical protein